MIEQDVFVGCVALAVGVFVGTSALYNARWYSRFWLARVLNHSCGPIWSRWLGGLLGAFVALLGVLIMIGVFSQNQRKSSDRTQMDVTDRINATSVSAVLASQ